MNWVSSDPEWSFQTVSGTMINTQCNYQRKYLPDLNIWLIYYPYIINCQEVTILCALGVCCIFHHHKTYILADISLIQSIAKLRWWCYQWSDLCHPFDFPGKYQASWMKGCHPLIYRLFSVLQFWCLFIHKCLHFTMHALKHGLLCFCRNSLKFINTGTIACKNIKLNFPMFLEKSSLNLTLLILFRLI